MHDSRLNGAERGVQQSFMKSGIFKSLFVAAAVMAAYVPIRALPDRHALPIATVSLRYRPVPLPPAEGLLRLAGAWELTADESRFGGLSALAIDRGRFIAVTDRGAVVRFDLPTTSQPKAVLQDLRIGPGGFGKKSARDAESLARDPRGRGWWVGYEQRHSLWLYDEDFTRAAAAIDLRDLGWRDNRGAEALLAERDSLLVLGENGRDAVAVGAAGLRRLGMEAGAEIADAARAPDGSAWLLLRSKGPKGIGQSIVPLLSGPSGYRIGGAMPLPKAAFDNYEGLAIAARPEGGWRFWLVTDDGHRVMARTLLVALDAPAPGTRKARPGTGLPARPPVEAP